MSSGVIHHTDHGNQDIFHTGRCPGRDRRRRRHSPARAVLGAAHVHDSRQAAQAASRRSLRARRAPRRHQRALVLVDDARVERPRDTRRRRAQLRADGERRARAVQVARRRRRRSPARLVDDAARRRMEPALQVLRQHGSDSPSPAPERCVREARRAERQARGVLLSSSVQPD